MRRGIAVVAAAGTLLVFQNCTSPPEESSLSSAAGSSTSSQNYQLTLPLSVTGQLDTVAYMSCSEIKDSVEKRAYFTFRAGAYSSGTGGLHLTPEFREKTKYYSATERARAFSASEVNGDTRFSLSIRSALDYQSPWISEELRVGEEIEALLPPLDAAAIAGPLAASAPGTLINYFPGAHEKRLVEGSLRFYKFENVMKDTRNKLEGGGNTPGRSLLVAGFSGSSDELNTSLRGPGTGAAAGEANPVFGKGYFLQFALPAVSPQGGERRVLSSVNEVDLQTSPPSPTNSQWDCSSTFQFQIVRPEDKAAGVGCDATVDRYNSEAERIALVAIRRVLRVEDWFVDLPHRCVIPKRTGDYCYGALQGRTIQYGQLSCTNGTTTLCPHYVSVCIRR